MGRRVIDDLRASNWAMILRKVDSWWVGPGMVWPAPVLCVRVLSSPLLIYLSTTSWGGWVGAITFLHLPCISSSWCYVTRTLDFMLRYDGFSCFFCLTSSYIVYQVVDLCLKYGKNKVWGGPVPWKKCAKSWTGYRKLHF
jgi:hypothetical protein